MLLRIINKISQIYCDVKAEQNKLIYRPLYKLIEIQEEDEGFKVRIKVIQKNITFMASPEEILADDNLVDQFSPKDVRSLTYLGYLGINSPKYEILAKRLSECEKLIFFLKKKGEKTIYPKTADEIIQDKDIIKNIKAEDAQAVGYAVAMESILLEKIQKQSCFVSDN